MVKTALASLKPLLELLFCCPFHMPGKAKILTAKEISDIFRVLRQPRDKAIFALGIYAGLRIGEIPPES